MPENGTMKLFFYAPQPKSLVLQAILIKRKERKLQYQWYHNFRSYLVAEEGFEPAAALSGVKPANMLTPIFSFCGFPAQSDKITDIIIQNICLSRG